MGVATLGEYAQNADDAQATTLGFVLDKRGCGAPRVSEGAALPDMAGVAAEPALLVYNSGVFTKEDMVSITSIGKSVKRAQSSTIGRYGIGSCSSYHFTDTPMFVTQDDLVVFDPHGDNLPSGVRGTKTNFVSHGLAESDPALARAFAIESEFFSCSLQASFPGTLFRLPLRSEGAEAARPSKISSLTHTVDSIEDLLSAFASSASDMLLFLKHVTTIFIAVLDSDDGPATTLLSVSIDNMSDELGRLRSAVVGPDPTPVTFRLDFATTVHPDLSSLWPGVDVDALARPRPFFVVSGGPRAGDTEGERLGAIVEYPPRGGIAFPLADVDRPCRAYTFLPLPITLNLPFAVNAAFALSANRRSLWSGADDMDETVTVRAKWNHFLITTLLPYLYVVGLQDLVSQVPDLDPVPYLPVSAGVPAPFSSMVGPLYADVCGPTGTAPALFFNPVTRARSPLMAFSVENSEFASISTPELVDALTSAGIPLLALPPDVVATLAAIDVTLPTTTPKRIATAVRRAHWIERRPLLGKEAAEQLLFFVCGLFGGDLTPPASRVLEALLWLDGVPVLPLTGDGLGAVSVSHTVGSAMTMAEMDRIVFGTGAEDGGGGGRGGGGGGVGDEGYEGPNGGDGGG